MLDLRCLTVGYGRKKVLADLSLSFARGQFTAVIGPNGCGKSTLLKSIVGILPLLGGQILVEECNLATLSAADRAKRIAYLSQGRSIPDMTVGQMVLHGRFAHLRYPRVYTNADREIAHEAMTRMGLDGFEERSLFSLSGGERQNAYVAMALAQCSDYILLDEPTTYLDIAHCMQLMDRLSSLAREGKGVVVVLHDLTLAMQYADQIVLLAGGRLLQYGTPEQIFQSGIVASTFQIELHRQLTSSGYAYYYKKQKKK